MDASKEQPQPQLCLGNCGFFGSEQFGNMCSKCFKATQPAQPTAPIPMPTASNTTTHNSDPVAFSAPAVDILQGSASSQQELSQSMGNSPGAPRNRCFKCRTKVSLAKQMSNKCKCGNVFCDAHKVGNTSANTDNLQSDIGHRCDFDFAEKQKVLLEKRNPKVKADSFTRI